MKIGAKTPLGVPPLGGSSVILGMLVSLTLAPAGRAAINDTPPATGYSTGDEPYSAIWTRNVFDLTPKPPPEQPKSTAPPPPNVKLIGIYTLFGKRAILTLQEPSTKPGQPPSKEESYTMTEGERRGGLELLEIDPKGRTVKIQNEGNTSTLAIETNKPSGGAPAPGAIAAGGMPHPFTAPPAFAPASLPMNQGGGVQLPPRQIRPSGDASAQAYGQANYYGATGYNSGTAASTGVNLGNLFNSPQSTVNNNTVPDIAPPEHTAAILALQAQAAANSGRPFPPAPPPLAVPGLNGDSGTGTDNGNAQAPSVPRPNPFSRSTGTFVPPVPGH